MAGPFSTGSMMGVALLHKCNFNCPHCGYVYVGESDDHIVKPGYCESWDQIKECIADCKSIKDTNWTMLFTGGEPTLWKEGDLNFIDLLLEVEKSGIFPSFNTNGSYFDDINKTRSFMNKYTDAAKLLLQIFISIDDFHDNFDRANGRSLCLENVVKIIDEMPSEKKKLFEIHVITITTNDPNSTLPEKMKEHYRQYGIKFADFPMMPIGKAKELVELLPESPGIKSAPPRPGTENEKNFSAVLMGDGYYKNNVRVADLGHLSKMYD